MNNIPLNQKFSKHLCWIAGISVALLIVGKIGFKLRDSIKIWKSTHNAVGKDIIDEASKDSFPASDAPAW